MEVAALLRGIKSETDLPLLAKIPMEYATDMAERAIESGADALTIGLGPRGIAYVNSQVWEGRLEGPVLKPLALRAVRTLAEKFPEIPIVGAGGVQTWEDAQDFLTAGAVAVQVDVAVWREPEAVSRWQSLVGDAANDQQPMLND
jgi:dihydroorotate dehydrogenase (NAD+) catalytic subunit